MEARSPATRLPQEPRTWARRMGRAVVTGAERGGNRREREVTELPGRHRRRTRAWERRCKNYTCHLVAP